MGFQQGLCRFVLLLALASCFGARGASAQMLAGFSKPAPYVTPAEDAYRYRAPGDVTAALSQTIVLRPPASMRQEPAIVLRPPASMRAAPDAAPAIVLRPPSSMRAAEENIPQENTEEVAANFTTRRSPLLTVPPEDIPAGNSSVVTPNAFPAPFLGTPSASAGQPQGYDRNAPVDLSADRLEHDDKSGLVAAAGNVELNQAGRILRAERVTYNTQTGKVTADGHVVLNEPNGDVHFAENVELSEEMSTGFVDGLQSYLADGGQFKAKKGERKSETLLTMHEASYTPCDCDLDRDGDPAWRIRADEVTYDETAHKISYKNPKFDIYGTPVMWLPYLSHSDGKIKRKSGLLTPDVGYDSQLGAIVTQNYYWSISQDKDLTIGSMLTTKEKPVALAQYRQRWANASFQFDGSVTESGRIDSVAGVDVHREDEWRGHVFADGKWDINEKWRAGMDVEVASDDQYLRQYDFSSKDVLENELYAERFSGRNYTVIRAMAFQDVRVREEQTDQPHILPEAIINFMGEPNATLGGRWEVTASTLGLVRDGSGQDVGRGTLQAEWQRRDTTAFGAVNTLNLSARGDVYTVNDRDVAVAGSGRSTSGSEKRFFPQLHNVTSMPFVKPMERVQVMVEPLVALTVAANINSEDGSIPNEDSQDVQIDATNLFEADRFPGYDRIEDRSRVTYGVRGGVYGYGGSHLTGFIGQSYNFNGDDNPFPSGSGLSRQESDVVGSIGGQYGENFGFDYRFQLDGSRLSSQRHEFDGYAKWDRLSLGSRYLFAKGLGETSIDESREQIEGSLGYYLTSAWRARLGALQDLGEDPGLRKAVFGLDYFGCCLSASVTAERNLTSDSSGDSGTDVMFRIGLKGLGEFQSLRGDDAWDNTGNRNTSPLSLRQ
jgi:LPS-assembly protein